MLEVLLEPRLAARLVVHPVAERHRHVRKLALCLLKLGVGDLADVLGLVAALAGHVRCNPRVPYLLPRLVCLVLRMDPVEAARAAY